MTGWPVPASPVCPVCDGEGWLEAQDGRGIDACMACTRRAEMAWQDMEHERKSSMWSEHTNRLGRGSDPSAVTMECSGGRVQLLVGRGALGLLPWFRGGEWVAVMLGSGAEAGRMRVMRGATHRLLTVKQPYAIEKLPTVTLRMDPLPHMRPGAEHPAEAVAHRILPGLLEVTLPGWAMPPVPMVAPPTSYQHSVFLPVEPRELAGVAP